jgi:hypothetical protein
MLLVCQCYTDDQIPRDRITTVQGSSTLNDLLHYPREALQLAVDRNRTVLETRTTAAQS